MSRIFDWWRARSVAELRQDAEMRAACKALAKVMELARDILDYEANPGAITKLGLRYSHHVMVQRVFESAGIPASMLNSQPSPVEQELRQRNKIVNFATAYGMGPVQLAKVLQKKEHSGV